MAGLWSATTFGVFIKSILQSHSHQFQFAAHGRKFTHRHHNDSQRQQSAKGEPCVLRVGFPANGFLQSFIHDPSPFTPARRRFRFSCSISTTRQRASESVRRLSEPPPERPDSN